jgi:hypothetical protein
MRAQLHCTVELVALRWQLVVERVWRDVCTLQEGLLGLKLDVHAS